MLMKICDETHMAETPEHSRTGAMLRELRGRAEGPYDRSYLLPYGVY